MFIDRLVGMVKEKNNPAIIGLDPLLEYVPQSIRDRAFNKHGVSAKAAAEAIFYFNKGIIDNTSDIAAAVKPQLAYYEMYGYWGVKAFYMTVAAAKQKGMIIIADGKRNDIGSTAAAYSNAYLGETKFLEGGAERAERAFDADALTVNPYLGIDGVQPFIRDCETHGKGIFVLVKTSNKSSGQIQDLVVQNPGGQAVQAHETSHAGQAHEMSQAGQAPHAHETSQTGQAPQVHETSHAGQAVQAHETSQAGQAPQAHETSQTGKEPQYARLYEVVAGLVDEWGHGLIGKSGYSSVGAVVGATYPEQARGLRKMMKAAYFLVPGYGAQGGTGEDAAASFNEDGLGAVVSASRSIMCAWRHERWDGKYRHEDFGQAAREELIRMRNELNLAIGR